MIDSYPLLVMGHGDEGRGDGIWRGIITSYLMKEKPALYRESMDRLTWWHDLSREPGGSIGIATLAWGNGEIGSSGPGIGLSYTAPLRTLRITGAPRTKFSQGIHPARKPVGHRGRPGIPLHRPQPEILRHTARTNPPMFPFTPWAAPITSRRRTSTASPVKCCSRTSITGTT